MNDIAKFGVDPTAMAAALGQAASESEGGHFGGRELLKLTQDGEWLYGQAGIALGTGARLVVNPMSFRHGLVSWVKSAIHAEKMVAVTAPRPLETDMPPSPKPYAEQWSFECADPETGVQMLYKISSMGGREAVRGLAGEISAQLQTNIDAPVPEIELDCTSYVNKSHGNKTIYKPQFTVVGWYALDAMAVDEPEHLPEPEPEPEPEPAPKTKAAPRQRRRRPAQ